MENQNGNQVEGQAVKPIVETNVVKPRVSFFSNEQENRLISVADESVLDSEIQLITDFMNNNHGKGKSDKDKDNLYGQAKQLWSAYATTFKNSKYTFYLNRKQYQFLSKLLGEKLEYDVNTVFFAIELTNMLGSWVSTASPKDDKSLQAYTADATEVTYIYHLISKHKVKGLTADTYLFTEILKRIGDISKIISYYDTHAKNLSKEIQEWVASFEDGVLVEGKPWGREVIAEETKTPAKKAGKSKKAESE